VGIIKNTKEMKISLLSILLIFISGENVCFLFPVHSEAGDHFTGAGILNTTLQFIAIY
jgi:hypothetical protein